MKTLITDKLSRYFAVTPEDATEEQIYKATVLAVKDILTAKRQSFKKKSIEQDQKRVFYLCMEFPNFCYQKEVRKMEVATRPS